MLKFSYKTAEDIRRLKERLHGGYGAADCDPGKDYTGRDFEVVIEFCIDGSDQKYEAFLISSQTRGHTKRLETVGVFDGSGPIQIGRVYEDLVAIFDSDLPNDSEVPAVPTEVWLKRSNDGPKGFRKFVYFSKATGIFKTFVSPRSWEDYFATGKATFAQHMVEESIQTVPKISSNLARQELNVERYFLLGNDDVYCAFDAITLGLSIDGAWIAFNQGMKSSIQIIDVFFGPLDYGESLIQS
jgi:hypothetical protein